MRRCPPRSTPFYSSAASDVYKRRVLLSAADLPLPPARRSWPGALLLAWLTAVWLSYAWVQRGFERTALYDSRLLLAPAPPAVLCLGATTPAPEGVRVLRAEALPGARPADRRCFTGDDLRHRIAGLVDVQELANALAASYPNQTIGAGDFREKWDWRQATPQGRRAWVQAEAARINALQLPYLVERLPLNDVEAAIPGYGGWRAPRLEQRRRLAGATGRPAIGRPGGPTPRRTRRAPLSPLPPDFLIMLLIARLWCLLIRRPPIFPPVFSSAATE